jgi:hypothetical protein
MGGQLIMGSIVGLVLNRFRNHVFQKDLERHGVTASLVGKEEFAVTGKVSFIITDLMVIIVTVEGQFELVETKTLSVFRVSLCLFQFADQSIIHSSLLLMENKQKGTQ